MSTAGNQTPSPISLNSGRTLTPTIEGMKTNLSIDTCLRIGIDQLHSRGRSEKDPTHSLPVEALSEECKILYS